MMLGSKVSNYDACGLFRASHSHNLSTLRFGRHKTIVHWTMCALAERLS